MKQPPLGNLSGRLTMRPLNTMRPLKWLLAALVMACLGSALAIDGNEEQTVLQGLQESSDQFSTFLSMVESAGLTETLQGEDPITVLAPSDAAFDDLDAGIRETLESDPEQMASLVNGMILSGHYEMLDLQDAAEGSLAPLSGETYEVETTAGGLTVNDVGFAATDVDNVFSNGVVHVTNGVVLPQALRAQAEENAEQEDADTTADTDATDDTDAADANDATDATTPVAPAVPPTAPEAQEEPTTAFVRIVQLSPATSVDVVLTPTEEGQSPVEFGTLEYATAPDYQEIEPGTYLVNATMSGSEDALFDPPSETFRAGDYYTVAITGLQVPSDDEAANEDEGEGFGGWLRDLFGGDGEGDRDALAIRATTYQDEVRNVTVDADTTDADAADAETTDADTADANDMDTRVHIIDAAPGSPAFDVVALNAEGDRNVIADDMTYGNETTSTFDAEVTGLQVTAADSEVVALDLTDRLPLPADATVFLIGTTFEGAPFDVLVLPNGPAAASGATQAQ